MSTGLFADEEDGYNIDETKYKLKVDSPAPAPAEAEPFAPEEGAEDLGGLDDVLDDAPEGEEGGDDKPFDDEPFDAGVEADEDTDPEKYIQQLSGKLGQSLRQYTEDQGQPDFDLEKFAVNSVLSATHTSEMDQGDQKDIINKVKGAGKDDESSDETPENDGATDDSLDFGEEPVEEIKEELPLNNIGTPIENIDMGKIENFLVNNGYSKVALQYLTDIEKIENFLVNNGYSKVALQYLTDIEKIEAVNKLGITESVDLDEGLANWVGAGLLALSSLFSGQASAQDVDMGAADKVANAINHGNIDRDTIIRNYGDRVDTTFLDTYFNKDGVVKKQVELRKIANPEWSQTSTTTRKDYRGDDYMDKPVFGKEKTKFDRTYTDGETKKAIEKVKLDKDYDPSKFDMDKISVKNSGSLKNEDDTMVRNLKNMKSDADKILSMDDDERENKLKGMGWADDHISTSTDDTEEVADFLTTEGENPCWDGYEQVGMKMKDGKEVPNCVPIKEDITEAEYQGKKVELNKPMKGDVAKFKVYVKNDKGNVVKVNFGDKNMEIRRDDEEARKSFRARHKCDQKKDKTSAGYWSCKMWSTKSVSDILKESEKSGNFVDKTNLVKKLRLMENVEPMVEPKPITKPDVKPARPMRETERPFLPKRKDKVKIDPKGKTLSENMIPPTIPFNGKEVDVNSLEIEGIDRRDYPDFSDAFFATGYYTDGTQLSDLEIDKFQDENYTLVHELIFDKQLYL